MLWLLRRSQWDRQQRLVRLIRCPAWLPLLPLLALDGPFHWPIGEIYLLIMAGWPKIFTHMWLWAWLRKPLDSVSSLSHLLSLPCQGPMLGALSLSVAAFSLKRECPLRCLRILCELKHRPKTEKWVLRALSNISLLTSSGSQLLTFYMGYALPPPAHTLTLHKPLSSPFPGLLKQQ